MTINQYKRNLKIYALLCVLATTGMLGLSYLTYPTFPYFTGVLWTASALGVYITYVSLRIVKELTEKLK